MELGLLYAEFFDFGFFHVFLSLFETPACNIWQFDFSNQNCQWGVGTTLSAVGAVGLIFTLVYGFQTARYTGKMAEVAERTMVNGQRAYLTTHEADTVFYGEAGEYRSIRFEWLFENTGLSPAVEVEIDIVTLLVGIGDDGNMAQVDNLGQLSRTSHNTINPRAKIEFVHNPDFFHSKFLAASSAKAGRRIIIVVFVEYSDVFKSTDRRNLIVTNQYGIKSWPWGSGFPFQKLAFDNSHQRKFAEELASDFIRKNGHLINK